MSGKYDEVIMKPEPEPEVEKRKVTPIEKEKGRSNGYWELSSQEQWDEDKRLGYT